jgi:hypothetical protein
MARIPLEDTKRMLGEAEGIRGAMPGLGVLGIISNSDGTTTATRSPGISNDSASSLVTRASQSFNI